MLDIKTAFLMWGTQAITLAVLLITIWLRAPRHRYYGYMAIGFACHGIGAMLIALRNDLPPPVAIYGGNAIVLCGFCFWICALRLFDGRKPGWWIAAPLLLWGLVLIHPVIRDTYAYRLATHQFASMLCFVMLAVTAMTSRMTARKYRRMLAALWTLQALSCAVIGSASLIGMPEGQHEVALSDYIGLFVIVCLVSAMVLLARIVMDRNERELKQLSRTDPLTGALNRRGLIETVGELKHTVARDRLLALLVFDLDYFKHINDTFGHQAGDTVLSSFAQMTGGALGNDAIFARSGGEEFCAVMPVADLRQAAGVAERIRYMIASTPITTEQGVVRLTTSIGLSAATVEAFDFDTAMRQADHGLYTAKADGRNRTAVARGETVFCLTPNEERGTPAAIDNEADRQVAALRRLSQRSTQQHLE